MLRSEKREIGGKTWQVTTMGADDGLEVGAELAATLLPVAGRVMGAMGGAASILDLDLSVIGDAATELAARIKEPAVRKLIKKLVTTNVHVTHKRPDGQVITEEVKDAPHSFGLLFAGDYDLLLQVAAFSIEVNFKLPFASWLNNARRLLDQPIEVGETISPLAS